MSRPSSSFHSGLATLALILACSGCNGDDSGGDSAAAPVWNDLGNAGYACLVPQGDTFFDWYDAGTPEPLPADDPVDVVVVLADCHSGSVSGELASCSVSVEGDVVTVVSEGGYYVSGGPQVSDCNVLSATCSGPVLTEGSWMLTYGEASTAFEVPTVDSPCAP